MYPAQSITATGKVSSIAVDIKKTGSPVFNIRAKIYTYVPANLENGFPLPVTQYVGQSTNVITASGLSTSFAMQTFNFNNLSVTGQWIVVFVYENEITHYPYDEVNFGIGGNDPYVPGDFIYYMVLNDTWYIATGYDMIFDCIYCNEGEEITTTTTTVRCLEYIMICTTQGQEAQFLVVHCNGQQETITVVYDQPQFLCLQYPPMPLDEYGIFDFGRPCEETTTTTTTVAVTTTTTTRLLQ
jgi:hypothetical protein